MFSKGCPQLRGAGQQRVVAGVTCVVAAGTYAEAAASIAGPYSVEQTTHVEPGLEGPACDTPTLEISTMEKQSSAAEMLKQVRLQRLKIEAISEEESKVFEERIEGEQ